MRRLHQSKPVHYLAMLVCFMAYGQCNGQYLFERNDSILVDDGVGYLRNPWAGGINFGQFSKADFDLDGLDDLFVFDRSGFVSIVFRNAGSPGVIDYVHAFDMQKSMPYLHDWALLADYNCDGKNDIFSYSTAGFSIYENKSVLGSISFEIVPQTAPYTITSALGTDVNLYVTSSDIPAIVDVDNDSDLDVLTFDIFGSTMEYHQNMSIDSFGTCDSIRYLLSNMCWGNFREAGLTNDITLFDTCAVNVTTPRNSNYIDNISAFKSGVLDSRLLAHSGSSVLALDLDGNGVKELVLGDISFSNLLSLQNGGTLVNTNTSMTSQDVAFPQNHTSTIPVDITLFPASYFLDIDNDGARDLIAAPNAINVSENFTSCWYYNNIGSDSIPVFDFVQDDFIQEQMIDCGEGAYPQLFDYNADGLKDLLISNMGYHATGISYISGIAVYENVGSITDPQFQFVTSDYMNLSALPLGEGLHPAFGDIDGDGDDDMFLGNWEGKVHYFINTAGTGNPPVFALMTPNYTDDLGTVIDVGEFSTPQLFDLDRDNDLDLLIGERRGNINYYENIGTATSPIFTLTEDTIGNVTSNFYLENYGYSVPFFFEDSSSYRLFVGTNQGYVRYYDNIDGNLTGTFDLVDSMYMNIWEGVRSGVWVEDINGDNMLDMFYGNYRGGLAFYEGVSSLSVSLPEVDVIPEVLIYPNPSKDRVFVDVKAISGIVALTVYDLLGQMILQSESITGRFSFEVSGLSPGIYLMQIENNGHRITEKIIIDR